MCSTLARNYTNDLNITIYKNEVVGDCCANVLHIDTEMHFCTDINCGTYITDDPL